MRYWKQHQNKEQKQKIEVLKYAQNSIMALLIWNFDESVNISFTMKVMFLMVILEEDNSVTGTLSDKINDAVDKMREKVLHH